MERNIAAMADDLGAELDQLLLEAGQRPRLHRLGHGQRAHEIAQIVGQRMELEADGVDGEGAARQPRPFDRAFGRSMAADAPAPASPARGKRRRSLRMTAKAQRRRMIRNVAAK